MTPFDASSILEDLKAQNPDMFREFFELNCIQVKQEHVQGRQVLDIGANLGFFSIQCRTLGSDKVIALEPHSFGDLAKNVKDIPGIMPIQAAAMRSGDMSACIIEGEVSSNAKSIPGGDVQALSIGQMLDWFSRSKDLVLKVDIEGSEYDIMLDASGKDLRRFSTIYLETHQTPHLENREARTPGYLLEYMTFLGFRLKERQKLYKWEWDEGGNLNEYQEIPNTEFWTLIRND